MFIIVEDEVNWTIVIKNYLLLKKEILVFDSVVTLEEKIKESYL